MCQKQYGRTLPACSIFPGWNRGQCCGDILYEPVYELNSNYVNCIICYKMFPGKNFSTVKEKTVIVHDMTLLLFQKTKLTVLYLYVEKKIYIVYQVRDEYSPQCTKKK